MIRETISKIEARLQGANACSDEVRAELLQLLGELKREISNVDEEQALHVDAVLREADAAAHVAAAEDAHRGRGRSFGLAGVQ